MLIERDLFKGIGVSKFLMWRFGVNEVSIGELNIFRNGNFVIV